MSSVFREQNAIVIGSVIAYSVTEDMRASLQCSNIN